MVTDLHWFVLKAASHEWGCSILETRFAVSDLAKLQSICDQDDLDYIRLDAEEVSEIAAAFDVALICDGCDYDLARWKPSVVPYLIHTNFELPLMLDGRKPLAVFWDAYPSEILDYMTAPFAPYVSNGQIVSRIIERPLPQPKRGPTGVYFYGTTIAYFAMPDEVWRIDAYERLYEEQQDQAGTTNSNVGWAICMAIPSRRSIGGSPTDETCVRDNLPSLLSLRQRGLHSRSVANIKPKNHPR